MTALILGATSPIARAIAAQLAQRGHAIFVAARDPDEARAIAADLHIRYNVPTDDAPFDATAFDAHPAFVRRVEAALGPIDLALIAFGDMGDQRAAEHDFHQARRIIDTNYTGAASICEALADAMIPRRQGTLIGIASVAGDRGRQSNYLYGSAKGAFALYLQGLRNRLHPHGVHVLTVKPGFIDTRMTFGMKTAIPIASPESLATATLKAADLKLNTLYWPPFWAPLMGVIRAIPEELFKRLKL